MHAQKAEFSTGRIEKADILSEVLNRVHLTGALTFRIDVNGLWCLEADPPAEDFLPILPRGTNHIIVFHIVVDGECWFRNQRSNWVLARCGDVVVLPFSGRHQIGNQPDSKAIPLTQVLGDLNYGLLKYQKFNLGDGPQVSLLCGFLGCNRLAFEPLFASLPSLFCAHLSVVPGSLVHNAITELLDDSPGADSVRLRLTELLFLQSLRQFAGALPDDARGWLAAVRDPVVGRALHALHQTPEHDWTMNTLAAAAASSRSNLATRFRDVLGEPPMHYLMKLRMEMAAGMMHNRSRSLAGISSDVGYQSTAAFQRAFKRCFGVPPGVWRHEHETGKDVARDG